MRIAILIGHFPPAAFGGAELQAQAWATRLSARHEVTVLTRCDHARPPGRERRDGYTVVRLPVSPWKGWRTLADLAAIERALARLAPRPELLLCFQTFISGLAGTLAGRRFGIPAVVWVRGEAEYRLGASRFRRWLSPRVWAGAAGILVQSAANQRDLLDELRRHAPDQERRVRERIAVVENGVDLPVVSEPPRNGYVLSVGRLIADKGMDVVIEACARERRPLTIAGAGPERSALEALAGRLQAPVRFTGHADRESLAALYAGASTVVLAAKRGEGLPNVVLEAMAHGRPVVTTPCAGARDLVQDGVNGLLVPAGDPGALAGAIRRLREEDGLGVRLGAAARVTAERYAWPGVESRLEALLSRWGST